MKWNDDWRRELENDYPDAYLRLCECRNTKADVVIMTALMKKYNPENDIEDCFDRMIEWVASWNSQDEFFDMTEEEIEEIIKKVLDKTKNL